MSDYGQTTPSDIGGSLDYDPSSSIYDPGTWSGIFDQAINSIDTQISGGAGGAGTSSGSADFYGELAKRSGNSGEMGSGSALLGGVSPLLAAPTEEKGMFGKFFDWFDDDKNGSKVALAGSFLKGVFGSFAAKGQEKNTKRLTDIRATEVANAHDVANQKFANAGSIAQTNFGAPPQGLIYSDKLAPRQKRAGYTGAA